MARNQVKPQSISSEPAAPELITVLIPTRERADTLEYSLTTCINQTDDNLRILVSDNASQDNTRAVVERFRRRDNRVEYVNPGRRLGMSEHFEFALGQVPEGFVTVLGDDDALFPDALTTIRETLRTRPDTNAISWPFSFYGYPSLFTPSKNHLGIAFGKQNEVRQSRDWLARVMAFETFYFELPMVYHGLVRVTVLDKIRARSGRLIFSSVADVYLAIAVASLTENYYRLSNSLTLVGTSRHSYGAAGITLGEDSPTVQSFLNESNVGMHPQVPYLPLIPVIVLECLLRARDAGVLPDNLPIAYERCISRAFIELYAAGHSEKVFDDYVGRLEELCRQIDQTAHLERLKSYDSTARKALEDELALSPWPPTHQIFANVANTSVKDVAAAVDLAARILRDEALRQVCWQLSDQVREVRTAFDNRLSQLRELDALARNQQKDLEKRHLEFTERIASLGRERDQTCAESLARFHQIEELTGLLETSEKDRMDRLIQVRELETLAREQQKELEKRNLEFTERIALLGQQLEKTHAESTARFHQIEKLTELLTISEKDRANRQEQIDQLTALLAATQRADGEMRDRANVTSAPPAELTPGTTQPGR